MEINISNENGRTVIGLSGRFDFSKQRAFKAAYDPVLQQDAVKTLEVNLARIEYLDSSALGMLMLLRERAVALGKNVVLSRPNDTVSQILEIANFKKLFTII